MRHVTRLCGLVFVVAAILKAIRPCPAVSGVAAWGLGDEFTRVAVAVSSGLEATVGLALTLLPDDRTTVGAGLGVIVLFTVYVVAAGMRGMPGCGCFGRVGEGVTIAIVRNALMTALLLAQMIRIRRSSARNVDAHEHR